MYLKEIYKSIFKTFVIKDAIYMNNYLNDLTIAEMVFNERVKVVNLEESAHKMFDIAQIFNE